MKVTVFLYPYSRYGGIARFNEIVKTEDAVADCSFSSFYEYDDAFHFVEGRPIDEFTF